MSDRFMAQTHRNPPGNHRYRTPSAVREHAANLAPEYTYKFL